MSQENVEIWQGSRITLLPPLGDKTSQRRSLDERVSVRFPALVPLFGKALMRLPPRSRLRRFALVRLLRRGYAAANRRDFAVQCADLDPRVEWRPRGGLIAADLDEVVCGRDEYILVWQRTLDAFEDLRLEPKEYLDLGNRLVVTLEFTAHGSGSGVPVSLRIFQLLEFQRGLVVRVEDFAERSDALQTAGLSE